MRNKFAGSIMDVRGAEDCIRSSHKYTKYVFTRPPKHPIQGEGLPTRVLTEKYEVYPELDLDEVRPIWQAILTTSDFLWGDIEKIDVNIHYDYLHNRAWIIVYGGNGTLKALTEGINGLDEAISKLQQENHQ